MKIHTENGASTLRQFLFAMEHDRESFDSWTCCHARLGFQASMIIPLLLYHLKDENDHVFTCSGTDEILILSKNISDRFLDDIKNQTSADITTLNVGTRTRETLSLLGSILDDLEDDTEEGLYSFNDIEIPARPEESKLKAKKFRNPSHVLVVEDDPLTSRMVSNIISKEFIVHTAESAREAVFAYAAHVPDVVFLDINLPDSNCNGLDVLKKIISLDKDAYVVMLSGNAGLDNLLKSFGAGARGFIAKPFTQNKIFHYLRDYEFLKQGIAPIHPLHNMGEIWN